MGQNQIDRSLAGMSFEQLHLDPLEGLRISVLRTISDIRYLIG